MTASPDEYRPNVGIVVFNADGKVWIGKRIGFEGDTAWQFPQGGIDLGEDLEAAARRELYEETGITSVEILSRTSDWIYYDFPPEMRAQGKLGRHYRGQKQVWFAMRFTGSDSEIDLMAHEEQEFSHWQWCPLEEVITRVVAFKRNSYLKVLSAFRHLG